MFFWGPVGVIARESSVALFARGRLIIRKLKRFSLFRCYRDVVQAQRCAATGECHGKVYLFLWEALTTLRRQYHKTCLCRAARVSTSARKSLNHSLVIIELLFALRLWLIQEPMSP